MSLKIKFPSFITSDLDRHHNNYDGMITDVMRKIDSYNNKFRRRK